MATKIKPAHRCDHCSAPALKHAIVGLPIAVALEVGRTHGIPYTIDHFNLCESHLMDVSTKYVHLTEIALGQCTAHA